MASDGAPRTDGLAAVAFDMDGVLIDSEPMWQDAEIAAFADVGLVLMRDDCRQTMGFRVDEAVAHWHRAVGWEGATVDEVVRAVVDGVVERIRAGGEAMPGALDAVDRCARRGLRLAVATSSWPEVADAVLARLDLRSAFVAVCSAADEARGKPAPDVYRTACRRLGTPPVRTLAIEDSPFGVQAAIAAGMPTIAVPDPGVADHPALDAATVRLASLVELDDEVLDRLGAPHGDR